jgi:hypothetical protein
VGERGPFAERAGLSEARDGAVHEVGLDGREGRVVAAQARHYTREVAHHRGGLGMGEVQRETQLARVDPDEVGGLVGAPVLELQVTAARLVSLVGAFDLHDPRAEVGEESCAVGAGQHASEIQHRDTVEQSHGAYSTRAIRLDPHRPRRTS